MKLFSKIVLPFNALFPNEKPLDVQDYFNGISRQTLLLVGSSFLGFNLNDSAYSNPIDFFASFLSEGNQEFFEMIYKNLNSYVDESSYEREDYSVLYEVSSLSFFESVFDNASDELDSLSKEEIEVSILKAYLLLNQINTEERGKITAESIKGITKARKPAAVLLANQLHNYDVTNFSNDKLFSTQLIRAILFFEFLESKAECKVLLKEFYGYYDVKNYKEYLKRLLPLATAVIMKEKEAHIDIVLDNISEKREQATFLEKFMLPEEEQEVQDIDFRKLRATPLYKIEEGKYRIISPMFIIEMIYNGLYWRFKPINEKLSNEVKIKNFYDFKTYDFSEQYVLHRILSEIFGKSYLQKNGLELDAIFEGAPDYYARKENDIILFESKDIMLSAESKQTSDFLAIEKELAKKLYRKLDGTPKAVMQIINNVRRILKDELEFDKGLPQDIVVHPVLILHYRMFNVGGLNKMINFWFQDELLKLEAEGLDTSKIRPLVIIDIDALIFNKDVFSQNHMCFEECLLEYEENYLNYSVRGEKFRNQEEATQALKNSYVPFAHYLDSKVDNNDLRSIPSELKDKGYSLFD